MSGLSALDEAPCGLPLFCALDQEGSAGELLQISQQRTRVTQIQAMDLHGRRIKSLTNKRHGGIGGIVAPNVQP